MQGNLSVGQMLKQINDAIEKRVNNELRGKGLTLMQMWVLMALRDKEDHTYALKELEQVLGVAQSTCAGIVDRLTQKALVERFTDSRDRRVKYVRLTSAGTACCVDAVLSKDAGERLMMRGLSEEEQAQLMNSLKKIYHNIKG